jgi:hypothetical protein
MRDCQPPFFTTRLNFLYSGKNKAEMAEMTDAEGKLRPFGSYLHTNDVDAVYRSARGAGAVSIVPPAGQPFADRLRLCRIQPEIGGSRRNALRVRLRALWREKSRSTR